MLDSKKFAILLAAAEMAPTEGFRGCGQYFSHSGCGCCASCVSFLHPLTVEQRRTLANVVIEAWRRWAENPHG